jgi:3-methyladenine DNA glycosylase Tag
MQRCSWPKSELDIAYHDKEWGAPVHDDRLLFEFLILEGAQAGLSWSTILRKRANYRRAFAGFRSHKGCALHARPDTEADAGRGHRAQSPEDRKHREQCPRVS